MASPAVSNNSQQIASTSNSYLSSPTKEPLSSKTDISKDEPVSPPPPSRKDSDTAQLVEAELANRLNKGGWKRLSLSHSPLTPMTPYFRRTKTPVTPADTEGPEPGQTDERAVREGGAPPSSGIAEGVQRAKSGRTGADEDSNGERSRLRKRATVLRQATDASGSVELDGLTRVNTRLAMQKLGGQKALYRYMDVYENQRGWARLGSFKFSSRALKIFFHYNDPAPFTKFELTENGLEEVDLPYNSLSEVQLPSADWSWHSPEWMIDMAGDGITSYDGFQYNTHFRTKSWSPIVPKWHSYIVTCVRRRRWLRLMVYLPSISAALPDKDGKYHPPERHIPTASEPTSPWPGGYSAGNTPIDAETGPQDGDDDDRRGRSPRSPGPSASQFDTQDVWRGNAYDWSRCHAALKTLRSDGRRLELWRAWTGDLGEDSEEVDMTGMGRLSLERKRVTGEDDSLTNKLGVVQVSRDNEDQAVSKKGKGKWARGVRWTEDIVFGRGSTMRIKHEAGENGEEKRVLSEFMTDEPLEVDSSRAPREYISNVLKYHAEDILALFIYPDSRSKFHDILQRTGLLEAIPKDVSFTYSKDFRERVEV
ncbi:SubName: Full=Uncharacterized protein {ECO:0000313/EMBL:CCA75658.1} [Serendipita indica DSM 11827]|uniref:TECPR1-like DysF domain-containing protein n=1 Tax=Serendipita indica (strain DSM 11827) TaxID=1109443 RepID=G4TWG5_SERID|nr:SubName: Full=Uncharacterized protein {ECO:0000313/EMBL:CCA75658.1} [Serendipita indica DSM 11827]CCA75658.1 hypothetical protein PIIN_09648 [Serendipita indica DSM 11827]